MIQNLHILSHVTSSTVRKRERVACAGDIVTIRFEMKPEHGYIPDALFDTSGTISLVLGWGNFLPGFHELIFGMAEGESVENQSIDAGWGERKDDLIVTVQKRNMTSLHHPNLIQVGAKLHLKSNLEVEVIAVDDEYITVDANPPLAGTSFSCSVEILNISSNPVHDHSYTSPYKLATFALGCFWGAELAFLRVPGVVGTKVGYTHGITHDHPTYEDVCAGHTKHREAVLVVYDENDVSYKELMAIAIDRLKRTAVMNPISLYGDDNDSDQYKHGIYYHTEEQREQAAALLAHDNRYRIELKAAAILYDAEEYHQKYLFKGGQSARKGAKEAIRCFG
jgi:peptide-methionine (S)-S-oxide reductase